MLSFLVFVLAALASRAEANNTPPSTLHRRTYFMVAGEYVANNLSSVSHGQMYVEHLVPQNVTKPHPLVFFHGNGMTGSNFLNTPAGKLGWADWLMSKGYEIYLLDGPARGRSAWQIGIDGDQMSYDTLTIENHFTSPERFNIWPQAKLHTQWPGNGSVGDHIFDEFYKSTVPSLVNETEVELKIKAAGTALLNQIPPSIVFTHSQAGPFGWLMGDSAPNKVKAIVALEPSGPPFLNAVFNNISARPWGVVEIPIAYDPPVTDPSQLQRELVSQDPSTNFTCYRQAAPARKLKNLAHIPVLAVTSESSFHAVYDNCTVNYLKQAGVGVDYVPLPSAGIHGNGHMMFMEKNSLDIVDQVVYKWLHQHGF